ncbi:MAG: TSUP family transporter [Chitinivibrionales bacterium]|nr:TSUP family transporter [Chitinivibrionales bacterium]
MTAKRFRHILFVAILVLAVFAVAQTPGAEEAVSNTALPAWGWAALLFLFCLGIGILAVMAGVGGGVLFVPFVGTLFPFHMDFVRGASLFVALAGAVTASAGLMRKDLTFPRLVLPLSVTSSAAAIAGAMVGLALPESTLRILLGIAIMGICLVMILTKRSEFPEVRKQDALARALGVAGSYFEPSTDSKISWQAHRLPVAIVLFIGIGFLAGMFGLGAGWANVPVINLVVGAPLKVAVSSSLFVVSISDTAPAFIYLNSGAVLPLIAVPSVLGMMLGSRIGVRVMTRSRPKVVRYFVISLLALAGVMSLLKGLGAF